MHMAGYNSDRFPGPGVFRALSQPRLLACLAILCYASYLEAPAAARPAALQFSGPPAMFIAPHIHVPPQSMSHAHPESGKTDEGQMAPMPHTHPADGEMEEGHMHAAMGAAHVHAAGTPASSLVLALLLSTLALAAGLMLFARRALRRGAPPANPPGMDLLKLPVVGKFLRSRYYSALLIAPTMLVFALIVLAGLLGDQSTDNPAVLLTWILWWPAVVFTFFLVGRIWCFACPFGYLGDVAQKIFSLQWKVPRILRNMWWRMALFLGITWATTLWALDRQPRGTVWLALGETIGAMVLGVIFQKRAFCRYLCPVGGVFGLYSMTAPMRIGAKDPKVCIQACPQKNCYQACAWFQYPPALDRNAECTLCMECARVCPHDNIALRTQPIGADLAQFQPRRNSLDEATTIAAVLGVAVLQTLVMLNGWGNWESKIASWLHIGAGRLLYTIIFVGVGVVAPALLMLLVLYWSRPRQQARGDFFRTVRAYAYCFLPLGLALHGAHNCHHLFAEGGAMWSGLKRAVAQYCGWTSLSSGQELGGSSNPNSLFFLQWVVLMAGLYLAFRVGVAVVRRHGPPATFRTLTPILLFATAFTVMNLVILSAAMGHRH
jgi:polyferredoxin